MKLTTAFIALLFGAASASPLAEPEMETTALEKRQTCTMTGSNVKYYTCPAPSKCPARGQTGYKNQKIVVSCLTTGEKVNNNDPYWWRLGGASPYNGNYIPYKYVNCGNTVDVC